MRRPSVPSLTTLAPAVRLRLTQWLERSANLPSLSQSLRQRALRSANNLKVSQKLKRLTR